MFREKTSILTTNQPFDIFMWIVWQEKNVVCSDTSDEQNWKAKKVFPGQISWTHVKTEL